MAMRSLCDEHPERFEACIEVASMRSGEPASEYDIRRATAIHTLASDTARRSREAAAAGDGLGAVIWGEFASELADRRAGMVRRLISGN